MLLPEVALTVGLDSERIMTDPADVRPLAAVRPQVSDQCSFVWGHVVADVALVRQDAKVEAHVGLQDTRVGKHLVAETTRERAFRTRVGVVASFGSWFFTAKSRLLLNSCGGRWR